MNEKSEIPIEDAPDLADPFYHPRNIEYLRKKLEDYRVGQLKFEQHDLFEIED